MDNRLKITVVAGGTGGHFYPGLAVAKALLDLEYDVYFIVRERDYVIPLLKREGFCYGEISAAGLKRSCDPRNLISIIKLVVGVWQSYRFLKKNKPRLLLAMGGYLSLPPVVVAKWLGIPVFLHEQNVTPGLANRILGRFAQRILLSFDESRAGFKNNVIVTGNPVRPEFMRYPQQLKKRGIGGTADSKKGPTFLIFGGSQGAHTLNELMVMAALQLKGESLEFNVIHFTGKEDESWVREKYSAAGISADVEAFCHQMPEAYFSSDLVICRSGAGTISELMVVKKPALLIPYPFATGDHQKRNAQILVRMGAVVVLEQRNMKESQLQEFLRDILLSPDRLDTMAKGYGVCGADPRKASEKISQLIRNEIGG